MTAYIDFLRPLWEKHNLALCINGISIVLKMMDHLHNEPRYLDNYIPRDRGFPEFCRLIFSLYADIP